MGNNRSSPAKVFRRKRTKADRKDRRWRINMKSLKERETADLRLCHACNAEVRILTDKYCRRCGARQIHGTEDTGRLQNDQTDSYITPHIDPTSDTAHSPLPN